MFSSESQRIFGFFEFWLQIQNSQKKWIQNIQEYSEYLALVGFERRKINLEDLKRQKASFLISEYLFEFADLQLQRIEMQSKKSRFVKGQTQKLCLGETDKSRVQISRPRHVVNYRPNLVKNEPKCSARKAGHLQIKPDRKRC